MINVEKLAVFDIETVGGWGTLDDLQKDNPKMAELWIKRCEFLRNRYENNATMSDNELWELKAGLHAEFAKVACVSFGIYKDGAPIIKSICSEDEREVLEWTSVMLNNVDKLGMQLAGHTIERFDVPFLWKRYLANGMKPPNNITVWNKKPWDLTYFDVAKFWSNGTWQEGFTSLDTMATLFGIASPKDTMQASRVHDIFWKEKDLDGIKNYCEGDIRATIGVIKKVADATNI